MDKKEFKHHYLFSVKIHEGLTNEKAGQFYIKHGIIHWTSDDFNKVMEAKLLSNDKLFPSGITMDEALKITGAEEVFSIAHSIEPFFKAARINMCTIHKFVSDFEIDDEFFKDMVTKSHIIKSFKEQLIQSQI